MHIKRNLTGLAAVLILPVLTGCGSATYHQASVDVAGAETDRAYAVSAGMIGMANAVMSPTTVASAPTAVSPSSQQQAVAPAANRTKSPVAESDSAESDSAKLTGEDLVAEAYAAGVEEGITANGGEEPGGAQKQQVIAEVEVYDQTTGDLSARVPIYDKAVKPAPPPSAATGGGGGWNAFAGYLAAQQVSEARAVEARQRTEQVRLLTTLAAKVYLRPQQRIAAPFDPEKTLLEAIKQVPFVSAVIGLTSLGKAGIAGAGDVTNATLSNGATLGNDGSSGRGTYSAPVTTTIIPEIVEGEGVE